MKSPETPIAIAEDELTEDAPKRTWLRLGILAAVLVSLYGVGELTGATEWLTQENIQASMTEAGAWGVLLFIVAFALGNLVQVPGWVFIGAAVLAYGPLEGIAVSLVGGVGAVATSFAIARSVGGKALGRIKNPVMKRLLSKLDERPVLSVALLRMLFMVSPPLNYALALSKLSWRDYMVGSTLGIFVPITVTAATMGCFLN